MIIECPRCFDKNIAKTNVYLRKDGTKIQRYKCKSCRQTFQLEPIMKGGKKANDLQIDQKIKTERKKKSELKVVSKIKTIQPRYPKNEEPLPEKQVIIPAQNLPEQTFINILDKLILYLKELPQNPKAKISKAEIFFIHESLRLSFELRMLLRHSPRSNALEGTKCEKTANPM